MVSQLPISLTPRFDMDPNAWPPEPLNGLSWASSRHVVVIGHSSRSGHIMLPTYAPPGEQGIFFRYATIQGIRLN